MSEKACWRCGRTDILLIKVVIETAEVPKPHERFQCKDTLGCIADALEAAQKHLKSEFGAGK